MIAVVRGRDETRCGWRLVSRTGSGADVLASAGVNPGLSCHEALQRLCAGDGTLSVLRAPNAHFTWTLNDPGGAVVAESPAVHRDAETCRRAFADAQRAARSALSGFGHERHAG